MPSTHRIPRPLTTLTLLATASLTTVTGAGTAYAEDGPSQPPGSVSSQAPPEVDADSPGLKLADGAELAPAKVLDIKSVVEDMGGTERREDTNLDVKFALQAEVLFAKDSAKLNPEANARINAIAEEAKAQNATKLRVFGFTDDLGTYAHGKKLSKARANAVYGQLSKTLGPEVTYEVRGYSEDYPIASNATEEGRKKNRRVEVSFPRGKADAGTDNGSGADADQGPDQGPGQDSDSGTEDGAGA